ncbi:hypothetical protein Desaci_2082 [Desulfosporosinus acidiphilus SJ4]|uniref:Uncharacterized protein n=1 Tax=Desulfosporosinus acidiphilus (strain DSM 22704 / JCM 16185 / SJ4) TaxID=646529 RepID=I4D5I0_DESAJ|nr:hypothetical protein [Desulfosporosinus acidiphilus]AFM41054.1 hypothetical protein Desaci_2082 [Desulfosporosinus acidiphilus SJ4]
MKNKIPAIFPKEIFLLFVEILVIISPSYYAFSLPNSGGEGIILMLLFIIYPVLSIFIGILTSELRMRAWVNAIITTLVFLGLFSSLYNYTAFSYIPFYLALYFITLIVTKLLTKNNTVKT